MTTEQKIKTDYPITLLCPVCQKGKIMADHMADVNLAIQCGKCGGYYRGNLQTQRTEKARASPSARPKKK